MASRDPELLVPLALRLSRADELAEDLAGRCFEWARAGGTRFDERRSDGFAELYVASVDPVPPIVRLLFSDAVNQLRSALDNAVVLLIEHERGEPLTRDALLKSNFPIRNSEHLYDRAVARAIGELPELAKSHPIGQSIYELQPFRPLEKVREMTRRSGEAHAPHHLRALQEYSNADKHHRLRAVAVGSAMTRSMTGAAHVLETPTELSLGLAISRVAIGSHDVIEAWPYICMERPITGALVPPGAELNDLHRFVSEVALPRLGESVGATRFPPNVDIRTRGMTDSERVASGGLTYAHQREGARFAREAMSAGREVQIPDFYRRSAVRPDTDGGGEGA
ncbi:hypothetical protein [Microbacterium dauci]|uniref:DUF222 domain-containing protein n=1 Tax=Microbacterium dauci TaxID=3048008 RepID=A0ABT6ZCB5_9MICO|nr:hypothetical protein [Microbacterium sp. LX3-4]MDJ1113795.1 hypothetical protein [Microbacterium sp. LX3-4]